MIQFSDNFDTVIAETSLFDLQNAQFKDLLMQIISFVLS